jgi:hypothetical protein
MTDATSATSATPTAVFVHGGWADATGFDGSIRALRDRGFTTIGAVISNAATGNQQVQALVFIAGWMPDEGESIQQLLESEIFADSLVPAALRPVPFTNPDGSEGVDLYLDRELFPEAFAADVDPETAAVMAATQRPWSGAAVATPSGPPGGGPSRRGICSALRTEPSRRRGSASWPSVGTHRSRRWRPRTRPWCRSRRS